MHVAGSVDTFDIVILIVGLVLLVSVYFIKRSADRDLNRRIAIGNRQWREVVSTLSGFYGGEMSDEAIVGCTAQTLQAIVHNPSIKESVRVRVAQELLNRGVSPLPP